LALKAPFNRSPARETTILVGVGGVGIGIARKPQRFADIGEGVSMLSRAILLLGILGWSWTRGALSPFNALELSTLSIGYIPSRASQASE